MMSPIPEPPETAPRRNLSRRGFLSLLCVGLGALGTLLLSVPILGFILGPLFQKVPHRWVGVGSVNQFNTGETVEITFQDPSSLPWGGVTTRTGGWLRRESDKEFIAFAINCTHLGCPVRWEPKTELFLCPCHGGVYYSSGKVAGGPPPKPLNRYQTRIRNGEVQILTRPLPIT
jgi:menaquinol-cytochrome c reductase iron-sulfur subunit